MYFSLYLLLPIIFDDLKIKMKKYKMKKKKKMFIINERI